MAKTLKEISAELGYSFGTVSRAINNKKGVSEETRKKILQELDRLGYQPNRIAQSLVKQRSHLIGVILPDISNAFFSSLTLHLEEALESAGYHMLLFNTRWDTEIEKNKIQLAQANQVDGIIIKPVSTNSQFKKLLSVPTVLISQEYDDSLSWIDIDNFQTGYIATKQLISCGYKRIAFISCHPSNNIAYLKRCDGYIQALKEHGLPIRDDYITSCIPSIESGYNKMRDFFNMSEKPDAIFCCDDINAYGCLSYAKQHSINIPEDFGIIGCNDTVFTAFPLIDLTSISHSLPQMTSIATNMMVNLIEQSDKWSVQKTVIAPKMIYRSTIRKN